MDRDDMNRAFLENFADYYDATNFLEKHLLEKHPDEIVLEASVRFINNNWIAGVMFGKAQYQLDFD